jgi:hypothetical protein
LIWIKAIRLDFDVPDIHRNAAARRSLLKRKGTLMAQSQGNPGPAQTGDDGPVPIMQRLLDNPFLLLFLGVSLPAVLYLMWGIMEVAQIPIAK